MDLHVSRGACRVGYASRCSLRIGVGLCASPQPHSRARDAFVVAIHESHFPVNASIYTQPAFPDSIGPGCKIPCLWAVREPPLQGLWESEVPAVRTVPRLLRVNIRHVGILATELPTISKGMRNGVQGRTPCLRLWGRFTNRPEQTRGNDNNVGAVEEPLRNVWRISDGRKGNRQDSTDNRSEARGARRKPAARLRLCKQHATTPVLHVQLQRHFL